MKKLSLLSSISVALVCAAVPASFNWSSASVTPMSVDRAEARIGRPLTPMSVAGVSRRVHRREYRRAVAGAAVGTAAIAGAAAGEAIPGPPLPSRPDLRSPKRLLMQVRAMDTAQDPTRTR